MKCNVCRKEVDSTIMKCNVCRKEVDSTYCGICSECQYNYCIDAINKISDICKVHDISVTLNNGTEVQETLYDLKETMKYRKEGVD